MASIDEVLAQQDPTTFAIALSDLVFPRCDRDGFDGSARYQRGIFRAPLHLRAAFSTALRELPTLFTADLTAAFGAPVFSDA